MRLRIASLAFFLASVAVAVAWLTLLLPFSRLLEVLRRTLPAGSTDGALVQQLRAALPYFLAADLVVVAGLTFVVLYLVLGRPLRRTEDAIEQLGTLRMDLPLTSGGGPLLSQVQASLRRLSSALNEEQALTRSQLTELRTTNDRLSRTQAELVASERLAMVGRLAAGIAHEVGNPLSGILGYVSVLRSRPGASPEGAEYLARIEEEVLRIDGIVRGLLDLGRPQQVNVEPVPVAQLVRTCVQLVGAGPELKGVSLMVDVPDELVAQADPGPLSQVLLNLLINAAQAMGGSGEVRVAASRSGERIRIAVDDTGPGVPPELHEKIFEPFFTTKPGGKGTGLGLAMSLHLARAMGAELHVEDAPGRGARFVVELPGYRNADAVQ